MSWEIERRFLVRVDAALWFRLGSGHLLRQGYVRHLDPSLRIRVGEERGPVLASKTGSGIRRQEFEVVVPEEIAEALFHAAEDRVVKKVRWTLEAWELDRFMGALKGLALMEIELGHELDPLPESPSGVHIVSEVTDDNRFLSSSLAQLSHSQQRAFVRKVYEEVKGWERLNASD